MKLKSLIYFFLLSGSLVHANADWRTFTSTDCQRTFEGKLVSFNKTTDTVTVKNRQGRRLHFKQDMISKDDQAYVQGAAASLPPDVSLDVRFDKQVVRGEIVRKGTARTTNYDAGYKVILNNFTPQDFGNVEVEYVMIYHKDSLKKGAGEKKLVRGTQSASLVSNRSTEVNTETVQLTNFYQKAQANVVKKSCGGGGCGKSSTTVTAAQRSRDYLVGCIALVKVDGKVVNVSASAPNLLRQYQDELNGIHYADFKSRL